MVLTINQSIRFLRVFTAAIVNQKMFLEVHNLSQYSTHLKKVSSIRFGKNYIQLKLKKKMFRSFDLIALYMSWA